MPVIVISVAYRDNDICSTTNKLFYFLCIVISPKKNKPVTQAKRGRPKNEDDEMKLREIVPFRIDVEVARQLYLSFF